ncbi:MAG: HAD family hydrolase [Lachnospiraceae bacterium]|nr:HAD family hydrolase [Lachnospiraceae bacterium]
MIRLIASDMDGTLLNNNKKLPDEFPSFFSKLAERGIMFAPVSGRSYPHFQKRFGSLAEQMSFICSNGDLVMHKGEVLYHQSFTVEELKEIFAVLRTIPDLHPCLCGVHAAYYEGPEPRITAQMKEFFENIVAVDRVEDVFGTEPLGKISCIDGRDVQENSYPAASVLEDRFNVTDAGDNWLDVMPKGVDKGTAIRMLCEKLGIDLDSEVMIFGDYLNDMPMMGIIENTWCMKNGHPDIKRISGHVTEWTNEENGVIRTVMKELGIKI